MEVYEANDDLTAGVKIPVADNQIVFAYPSTWGKPMSVIHPSLFFILKRIPDRGHIISQAYRRDNTFKSICDDYQKCAEALEYWNRANHETAPNRVKEYSLLLLELEEQIRDYLRGAC